METLPHNFATTLDIDGQPTEFRFHTVNIKELQLFQVYYRHQAETTDRRFHMQRTETGDFHITDKHRLPEGFSLPEQQLANAILKEHGVINKPKQPQQDNKQQIS